MAYSPASNLTTTGTLTHLATVWYNRQALENLKSKLQFWLMVDDTVLPKYSGKTVQWFRYTPFSSNTTPQTEGTVGTGLSLTTVTVSATVSQYSDFLTVSDLLEATAIDPIVTNAAIELGYRAGLTCDNLIRNEMDANAASIDIPLLGDFLQAADFANARHQLQGLDIHPKKNGYFAAIAHPYVTYDLLNDPSAGGFQDLVKHSMQSQAEQNFTLPDRGLVARIHGCEVYESTQTTKIVGTPNKWRVYICGRQAIGAVDLAGLGPTRVQDPETQRFKVRVVRNDGNQIADPQGLISAAVAYNFIFTVKTLDSNPFRYRKIDAPSTIVA